MTNRPYFHTRTDQLQALFENAKGDQQVLKSLAYELRFRDRPKAQALKAQVNNALTALKATSDTPYTPPATGAGNKRPSVRPLEPQSTPASDRVSIECAHCKTSNFVSMLDGVTQNLSCAYCKAPYEAVFKYGVMRTKFADKEKHKPQSSVAGWILLGAFALIVILLMVK